MFNKYQLLKYAVIGLTLTSRVAPVVNFIKPETRTFTQYAEPTKHFLIHSGNAYWNYEVSQYQPTFITFQLAEQNFTLVN